MNSKCVFFSLPLLILCSVIQANSVTKNSPPLLTTNTVPSSLPLSYTDITPPQGLALPTMKEDDLFAATIEAVDANGFSKTERTTSNKSWKDTEDLFENMDSSRYFKGIDFKANGTKASAVLNLRGALVYLTFSVENGTRTITLITKDPTTNTYKTVKQFVDNSVTSKNRLNNSHSESVFNQLKDFLTGKTYAGSVFLKSLTQAFIDSTPIDPVAGNPNSFMATLVNNDYQNNTNILLTGDPTGLNRFSLTPRYTGNITEASHNNPKTHQKSIYLPLTFAHYFNKNNRLLLSLPLNYSLVAEAKIYNASLGISFTHVIQRGDHYAWALTPSLQGGAVTSVDMAGATVAYSAGIGSRFVYRRDRWTYGLTNTLDYLSTIKVKIKEIETPYDVKNSATENGIDASYQISTHCSMSAYFHRFDIVSGQKWFIPHVNMIGIALSKLATVNHSQYKFISVSAGYGFGDKGYKSFTAGLSVYF